MIREVWGWRDARTGQRVSQTTTFTREQAEQQLEEWRARDRRGKRPDIHDSIPHLETFRIHPPERRTCRDCGAEWSPVRRGECIHCGSDATPERWPAL